MNWPFVFALVCAKHEYVLSLTLHQESLHPSDPVSGGLSTLLTHREGGLVRSLMPPCYTSLDDAPLLHLPG